jgi:hypothetical protein
LLLQTPTEAQITNPALKQNKKIKKENKHCLKVDLEMVKHHLFVFVNCTVKNPTSKFRFKDIMTHVASFDFSKCRPSENFFSMRYEITMI